MFSKIFQWFRDMYAAFIMFWVDMVLRALAKIMHHTVVAKGLDPSGKAIYRLLENKFNGSWQEPDSEVVREMLTKIYGRTKKMMDEGKIGMIKRSDVPNPPDLDVLLEDMKSLEELVRGKDGNMAAMGPVLHDGVEMGNIKGDMSSKIDDIKNIDKIIEQLLHAIQEKNITKLPSDKDVEEFAEVFSEAMKDPDFEIVVHDQGEAKSIAPKAKQTQSTQSTKTKAKKSKVKKASKRK